VASSQSPLPRGYRDPQYGADALLRSGRITERHDYDVEISGGTAGAHYVSDLKEFSGILFPTKRRIFPRQPNGHSAPEPLVVSIDLDHLVLS